jgi:DNA polymerase-3 subunit delta
VSAPVHLIRGSDPALVGAAVSQLVDELVGDRERSEVVEEVGEDAALAEVVMAARSMSMFGDLVVVARGAARFRTDELGPLLDYLAEPNPSTTLVLVWEPPPGGESRQAPKKLLDAVRAGGGAVVDADPPGQAKQRSQWLEQRLAESSVALDGAARAAILAHLGEDVGRVGELLAVLEGCFAPGERLGAADVEPYLGEAGSVPPWELTDAIDRGDVPGAILSVQRMIGGDRHPLQIMATLQSHFERMLRLDGANVAHERAAAELLGLRGSTFPARKALTGARRLGSERLRTAIGLLAAADADLRGATGCPPEQVMEVLVGRLARLSGHR